MALNTTHRPARRAAVAGALALGAMIVPTAAPAMAEPVDVPGFGVVDIPGVAGIPGISNLPAPFALPTPIAPVQAVGERALAAAQSKLGSPYVYGASGPDAFDCSGLVQWAYSQAGIGVPRTSGSQAGAGYAVSLDDLRPGDILIYNGGGHAAMYAGNGNIIHASTSGTPVQYAPLHSMSIMAARRI
ncbi:C40 family peptidase [Antrihabitans sp. YC2-6]|uniref:C40 family peptidase n=1 Tax=Antrihabitans sp. YC2-6 TaxID=2799498 RepID=UPI0018F581B1|nr:C40 family peptidase [Antrihabitans sp. YC2-6]MBJ8343244.1 C40 family peptidase [Antrihabitans sp. YC2-6]